jgi:phytoene desaturase
VAAHFRSPFLRRIYNRYATYVGSSPYQCPATLLIIPFIEREFGAWYVQGGLYSIIDSLVNLAASRGIMLMPSARVIKIERTDDRATAVRLEDGTRVPADVVIMNGDAANAPALLGDSQESNPGSRSLSGVVLLVSAAHRPAGLRHHTVVFSADYETEFVDLCKLRRFPADPTVYVSAPAASDSSVAPAGGDALFVMANAPASAAEWRPEDIESASTAIRARLAAAGLELGTGDPIDLWHPARFRDRYLAPFGSIYGGNSHGWKNAFLRPPNRSRNVRGLYFVGGSSHPGGGTPTVLLSAKITSNLVAAHANA